MGVLCHFFKSISCFIVSTGVCSAVTVKEKGTEGPIIPDITTIRVSAQTPIPQIRDSYFPKLSFWDITTSPPTFMGTIGEASPLQPTRYPINTLII